MLHIAALTHRYGDINLSPDWLREGLVAWQHPAITWINLTYHLLGQSEGNIASITKISLQITYVKFHSHLPGVNEFRAVCPCKDATMCKNRLPLAIPDYFSHIITSLQAWDIISSTLS